MFNSSFIIHHYYSSYLDTTFSCVQIETAILYILINFLRRLQKGVLHILPSLRTENMDQDIDYFTQCAHTPLICTMAVIPCIQISKSCCFLSYVTPLMINPLRHAPMHLIGIDQIYLASTITKNSVAVRWHLVASFTSLPQTWGHFRQQTVLPPRKSRPSEEYIVLKGNYSTIQGLLRFTCASKSDLLPMRKITVLGLVRLRASVSQEERWL